MGWSVPSIPYFPKGESKLIFSQAYFITRLPRRNFFLALARERDYWRVISDMLAQLRCQTRIIYISITFWNKSIKIVIELQISNSLEGTFILISSLRTFFQSGLQVKLKVAVVLQSIVSKLMLNRQIVYQGWAAPTRAGAAMAAGAAMMPAA